MRYVKSAMVVALVAAAGTAQAAGVGVKAGTTGLGVDFGWEIAPTLGGRIGAAALDYKTDVETNDVRYNAKLKAQNVNLFLDWSPLGPFRLTAGIVPNNNKIDVTGTPSTGGSGTFTGKLKLGNTAAPYLGIGWGNVAGAGVNFYADLGVMYMGSPKASLSANCGSLNAAQCVVLQSQVESEQRALEDKVKKYKYYPVVNIGLTIGF